MVNKRLNQGFSLIEVLIAMFVLAIGLLGLMSMQLQALKTNNNSNLRSQATIAAYDMSDRIRANNSGFSVGSYDSVSETNDGGTSSVALQDIKEWKEYLAANLPDGKGSISTAATGASDGLDIKVTWTELDSAGTAVTKEFILRARFE
jgi:type IV pilus assembly protein PilV